jgi:hypothetical protein
MNDDWGKHSCEKCGLRRNGFASKKYRCTAKGCKGTLTPIPECTVGPCRNEAEFGQSCAICEKKIEELGKPWETLKNGGTS